jgi:hypothetical protein
VLCAKNGYHYLDYHSCVVFAGNNREVFFWEKLMYARVFFLALCARLVHRPILQIHCLIFWDSRTCSVSRFRRSAGAPSLSCAVFLSRTLPRSPQPRAAPRPTSCRAPARQTPAARRAELTAARRAQLPAARRAQPPAARASSAAAARGSSAATACVLQCCCRARHELSRARWIRRDPWRRPRRPRLDLWRGTR